MLAGMASKLLLTRTEAAESLSMSLRAFEQYVQPHLALIRRGRMRLVPVTELERWIASSMEQV